MTKEARKYTLVQAVFLPDNRNATEPGKELSGLDISQDKLVSGIKTVDSFFDFLECQLEGKFEYRRLDWIASDEIGTVIVPRLTVKLLLNLRNQGVFRVELAIHPPLDQKKWQGHRDLEKGGCLALMLHDFVEKLKGKRDELVSAFDSVVFPIPDVRLLPLPGVSTGP